jgi:AcrR family transcriptional regulator
MSANKTSALASPRERLLSAANQLFYEEGVHTVGIDRLIERAGVAKASLYSSFGSKEELVRAYLAARSQSRRKRIEDKLAGQRGARQRVLAVFDLLGELFVEPTFRGCAFVRASAEGGTGGGVREVCDDFRSWVRSLFTDLAREAGAAHPERLAQQLVLLYDGATVSAQMDRNPAAAAAARAAAGTLLDAHLQPPPQATQSRTTAGARRR